MMNDNSTQQEELVVVEAEVVKPRRPLRNTTLWIHTWLLLSLAAAAQQLSVIASATDAPATNNKHLEHNVILSTPSTQEEEESNNNNKHDLEVSEDHEIEEYHHYHHHADEEGGETSSWADEHLATASNKSSNDIIVIATVDGSIAGLEKLTGEVVWKQSGVTLMENDYGVSKNNNEQDADGTSDLSSRVLSPLVSTTTTTKTGNHDWKTAAVPSVDGRVLLSSSENDSCTSTLKELVARAPFVDKRGRFYVGSRQATAAALDRDTGEIVRVVSGQGLSDQALAGRNIVWVGRVDYSVSLFDARSGVMDVKFSSSEIMGVQDMVVDNIENMQGQMEIGQHAAPRLMLPAGGGELKVSSQKMSMLVATPSGNVALRNPDTGNIEWVSSESFDSPVAFALEAATGISLGVDILPDAPKRSKSVAYLASQLERQITLIRESADEASPTADQFIVGALSNSDQLFAMPLGKRLSQEKSAINLALSHGAASTSSLVYGGGGGGGSSKQIASSRVPNLGIRNQQRPTTTQHHHTQHNKHQQLHTASPKMCVPSSPNYPGCLVGNVHDTNEFGSPEGSFLDANHQPIVPPQMPPPPLSRDQFAQELDRKMKRYFTRLCTSWLFPTMLLLFLAAFNMGRRIKENNRKTVEQTASNKVVVPSATTTTSLESSSGDRNVGVISVTDSVLGFGGHGTVVYKGMLDGRQVAVKRMLKAYHASADREISLFIESDGHPNVVRYFLKEVKGDFVYLALELCDMSLHELIVLLRQNSHNPLLEAEIATAIKSTLYQVACGVRHLHSLRIVHRDLKPANILLARKNAKARKANNNQALQPDLTDESEIMSKYEKGEYIAKISDMGLGKQLVGQSSFGVSTLGNSSINNPSNGGESRLANGGGGPGSVGWQAPEVMAMRWSSETASVKSNSSNNSARAGESFPEASPLDGAMSTRTSRSVDIFSLGCIFHCTLVPGIHPFGEWYEREANIMKNKPNTHSLEEISPDAQDLVKSMVDRDPHARPTAKDICDHLFFWDAAQRLAFLCDVSDRIESDAQAMDEGKEALSQFGANIFAIERNAAQIVGTAWDQFLDADLVNNVAKFRTYDPSSVRDCLRLVRNKHHHYDELPQKVKQNVGSNPDGLLLYFESKFPKLSMHCYEICRENLDSDDPLAIKYSITCVRKQKGSCQENKLSSLKSAPVLEQVDMPHANQADTAISQEPPPVAEESANNITEAVNSDIQTKETSGPSSIDNEPIECKLKSTDMIDKRASSSAAQEYQQDMVIWEGSTAAKTFKCRGWLRADDEWTRRVDASLRKRDSNVARCATDGKFRTRLCNHWDTSRGTFCPMKKKNKCVFAHGPVELRVKDGKKNRWGRLVDKSGNNSNPSHSGGEDTYGAARSIETMRKDEGKWNTDKNKSKSKGKQHIAKKTPAPGAVAT